MAKSKRKQKSSGEPRKPWYSTLLIVGGLALIVFPFMTEAYGIYAAQQLKQEWEEEARLQARVAEQAEIAQERLARANFLPPEEDVLSQAVSAPEPQRKPFPSTKVIIPKIGLDQVISEGVSASVLKNGPGHYPETVNPGEAGNVGIAGHRVTYTRPFNRLDELAAGDTIKLETLDVTYEYEVTEKKILKPKDVSMLRPTSEAVLTLTTCNPKFSARQRLDVRAVLVREISKRPVVVRFVRHDLPRLFDGEPEEATKVVELPQTAADFELLHAEELVRAKPSNELAHLELGTVYMDQEKPQKALEQFRAAVLMNPLSDKAHYYLGLFRREEGEEEEAIKEFIEAARLNEQFEPALYELGLVYYEQGRYADAASTFKRAIETNPLSFDTHYQLGRALEKLDRASDAIVHYKEALRFDPTSEIVKNALERLEAESSGTQ